MALLVNFINTKDVVGRGNEWNCWKCPRVENMPEIKGKCPKEMRKGEATWGTGRMEVLVGRGSMCA